MNKNLKPEERLIIAADYSPKDFNGIVGVDDAVLDLAEELKGLGVYIKVNSALRAFGYGLIDAIHGEGLKVCADLKLIDIPKTMEIDGQLLREAGPELLTVMCCAGINGMNAVKKAVGESTEVIGVTILTSLNNEECQSIFSCSTEVGVLRLSQMARLAGLGGLVLSPQEACLIDKGFEIAFSVNCPGIRPKWSVVENDDQARVLTPYDAIKNGADRIIVGRPITGACKNDKGLPDNPREAVLWTLREIEDAMNTNCCC